MRAAACFDPSGTVYFPHWVKMHQAPTKRNLAELLLSVPTYNWISPWVLFMFGRANPSLSLLGRLAGHATHVAERVGLAKQVRSEKLR